MSAPGVTHGLDHDVSRRLAAAAADQIPSVAKSFWSSSAFVSSVTRIPGNGKPGRIDEPGRFFGEPRHLTRTLRNSSTLPSTYEPRLRS
jgi:hypothetical protein